MAKTTFGRGACVAPYLQLSNFPGTKGFMPGRMCTPVPSPQGIIDCCLPCPITQWVYSDNFNTLPTITGWLNVSGMICCFVLLLSYIVLPGDKTSRHYLNLGLVVSLCLIQLAFIVPLGAKPEKCYDAITPNDMYSDFSCALSGALIVLGGFAAIMWGFLRSLSLHVQVCWQVVPGRKFFWGSIVAGIGGPLLLLSIALPATGVSYRFGDTCHINHEKALGDYWGPLLTFAAVSAVLQFTTFGYCIKVYIRSLFDDSATTDNSSGLPRYTSSVRTVTAKQAFRRIKKVVLLQWRSILIVLIIIANVVFLSVVFISMDNTVAAAKANVDKARPWLICLVVHQGDKTQCWKEVGTLVRNESTVMAVLILLSLNGYWSWLFLGRTTMVSGWIERLKKPFSRSHDFVSVDARRLSSEPRHYEMILSPPQTAHAAKSPDPLLEHETETAAYPADKELPSPLAPSFRSARTDYFGKPVKYTSPTLSFSTPRPPSAGVGPGRDSPQQPRPRPSSGREWDPESTHARGSPPSGLSSPSLSQHSHSHSQPPRYI